jgi:hypothetical protein
MILQSFAVTTGCLRAFSCRPFTAKVHACVCLGPFEVCGGQSGTGTVVLLSFLTFLCQYHSTVAGCTNI